MIIKMTMSGGMLGRCELYRVYGWTHQECQEDERDYCRERKQAERRRNAMDPRPRLVVDEVVDVEMPKSVREGCETHDKMNGMNVIDYWMYGLVVGVVVRPSASADCAGCRRLWV